MAKDPATLWYWNDWHSGTILMSRFLKGCYMDLLHAQFNHGPLSLDEVKAVLGGDFGQSWPSLQKKFSVNPQGLFFNERMENEKDKRSAHSKKQKENAFMRWHKSGICDGNTKTMPLENENRNEDEIKNFGKSENLFHNLTTVERQNSIEYLDRVAQKKYSANELDSFFEAFKIQYSKDFYPSRGEIIKHFRNWLKNQKNGNSINTGGNTKNTNLGSAAGATLLLNKLKQQLNG